MKVGFCYTRRKLIHWHIPTLALPPTGMSESEGSLKAIVIALLEKKKRGGGTSIA